MLERHPHGARGGSRGGAPDCDAGIRDRAGGSKRGSATGVPVNRACPGRPRLPGRGNGCGSGQKLPSRRGRHVIHSVGKGPALSGPGRPSGGPARPALSSPGPGPAPVPARRARHPRALTSPPWMSGPPGARRPPRDRISRTVASPRCTRGTPGSSPRRVRRGSRSVRSRSATGWSCAWLPRWCPPAGWCAARHRAGTGSTRSNRRSAVRERPLLVRRSRGHPPGASRRIAA